MRINENDPILSFWKDFLRFKSISTEPQFNNDCRECAKWLTNYLNTIPGIKSEIIETKTKPLVFAEIILNANYKTILFYGHYDVQPPDPYELWSSPPFEPTLKDNRIYARGAQDNKGQVAFFIQALKHLIENKQLNCNVKLLIEGEEETGSMAIALALPSLKAKIAADLLLVCDTGVVEENIPTITMGLKGIVGLNIAIKSFNFDLHSGVFGGLFKNPALALGQLLNTLYNPDGSIAVPGFYDGMKVPSDQDLAIMNACPVNLEKLKKLIGQEPNGGETKFSVLERMGWRPNIEINGIQSGYNGPGQKTVIANSAKAWITSRITEGQDPKGVVESIKKHLIKNTPKGIKLEILAESIQGGAVRFSTDNEYVKLAASVLKKVFKIEPAFYWLGASVPIVAELVKYTNNQALLIGFGEDSDQIHAPNESFSIRQFEQGYDYAINMLQAL